jgi:hypothetical protein
MARLVVMAKRPTVPGDVLALERHAELLHDASRGRVRRVTLGDDASSLR